uniref:PQ-loop repeat-containing protein 1 n=1 Tax=Anopheles stephensi TaxID=30069 RepID=A0A182YPT1_ANOST
MLVQSVVMNITMFLMIHLCVRVRRNNAIMHMRERVFSGTDGVISAVHGKGDDGGGVINIRRSSSTNLTATAAGANATTSTTVTANLNNTTSIGIGSALVTQPSDAGGQPRPLKKSRSRHYILDFDSRYFWQWTDFQSYVDFMLVVWAVGAAITYLMLSVTWFMETIGFLAVFTEAMLGLPQFVRNYKNKSTHGMSICMVIMWTAGDMFKTGYFILRHAPTQFWICGTLQVSLDLAILLQVYIYRKNPAPRSVNNNNSNKNSIHSHRHHSSIRSTSRAADSQHQPLGSPGNGCTLLSSPDSNDTAPILPGRRDVGVGCNRLLGLAPLATACSSSAASSFYNSILGAECSVSLRSRDRSSLTPGRNSQTAVGKSGRLATRFQHSKSHSISSSPRETTPVRNSAVISVRGGSDKFSDRQKTASLPLPKRRQLSLSAHETTTLGLEEGSNDRHNVSDDQQPSSHVNIPTEETFNGCSLAGDNCSFDTATSGLCGPHQARDSSCTLNSNSYKEQYILGCGHYRSNLKHYDALLAGGGCVVTGPPKDDNVDALAMVEFGERKEQHANASSTCKQPEPERCEKQEDEKIATVQPKTHHYPTNAKSLEDIL